MAVLARRTWAQIRAEVLRRLGNFTGSDFSTRVEYFLAEANYYLATHWHHFELDAVDTSVTLSTSTNSITLPTDTYILLNVKLLNAAGTAVVGELQEDDFRRVIGLYRETPAALPKKRARFGTKLYFDCKPDIAYRSEIYYYKLVPAPDFSGSDVPVFAADCDAHLIELAVSFASTGIRDYPAGEVNRTLMETWAGSNVRLPTVAGLPDYRERKATNSTLGGAQG